MRKLSNLVEFEQDFVKYGREDNFSKKGLEALFNYLKKFENDLGEEIEIDVIDLCCGFLEMENLGDFNEIYGQDCETLEDIEKKTQVIKIHRSEKFIIQNF